MIRGGTILWAFLAVAFGVAMFLVKYQVQDLEEQLQTANARIRQDRAQIHVLEAEWAYLNQPDRLRRQAERHLGLGPIEPSQVTTIAALPPRPGSEAAALATPWPGYPMRKPGSGGAAARPSELASTRVSP
jgi:cell division protein FtsL